EATLLEACEQRRFLLHSVDGDDAPLFQTPGAMAYLRGPLLREETRRLTAADAAAAPAAASSTPRPAAGVQSSRARSSG
ncbi:MAG: hypothetical protein ACKON8_10625, partial [Planctomycetota bacterium]